MLHLPSLTFLHELPFASNACWILTFFTRILVAMVVFLMEFLQIFFASAIFAKLGVRFALLANLVSFMSSVAEKCGNFFLLFADLAYFHICVFFFSRTVVAHVLLKPLLASWIWTVGSTFFAWRVSASHAVIVSIDQSVVRDSV